MSWTHGGDIRLGAFAAALVLGLAGCAGANATGSGAAPSVGAAPGEGQDAPHGGAAGTGPARAAVGEGSLVALPSDRDPLVAVRLVFRAGSIDDPAGREGITALTAALMAEGTRKLSSAQLREALYPMAAELSVQTDKEATAFIGLVHRDHLPAYSEILTDVLTAPRFDPADFERIKTDAIKSIQLGLRSDNDEELGKAALEAFLYPSHPYGQPPFGTVQGLKGLKLEDLKAHAARVFTGDRLTVGVAGGFPAGFPASIEARLASLPATGAAPVRLPLPAQARGTEVMVVEKDTASTAISVGFPIPVTRSSPAEYAALRLAASYLGEHRASSGVLFQRLRDARGLNYGDYAYAEAFIQEGYGNLARNNIPRSQQFFSIWIRPVPPAQGVFALRAALREFDRMVKDGLSQQAFERTRSYLLGYSRLWEQTADRRLGYRIDGRFYGAMPDLNAFREVLQGLTLEQVNAAMRRHLSPAGLRVAVVTKDAQAFAAALRSGAPSPITYTSPKAKEILEEDRLIQVYDLRIDPAAVRVVPVEQLFEK